jgi:ribose 5-phosphate isomerase A
MTPALNQGSTSNEKQLAAAAALSWVRDGMVVGLGSGSTTAYFISVLGQAIQAGTLRVQAAAASLASEALAREAGIPLLERRRGLRFDLTVDGADEIDPQLRLIKGGGAALLREKVLAAASDQMLVIADSSKLVPALGRFPLPLEVVPFALPWVLDAVDALGGAPVVRLSEQADNPPALTDQGNQLVDCHFSGIPHPEQLAQQLQAIPGVVEHGLFIGLASAALLGHGEQVLLLRAGAELAPLPTEPA